ncbi:MAG: hypothetical protein Tsb0034_27280 [Ekhidna sp.]
MQKHANQRRLYHWDDGYHHEASRLLEKIIATSKTTIICGFSKPENWKQGLLLWLDQRFNAHYLNFRDYQRRGYMEGLLEGMKYQRLDTFDPVIKIYVISQA